MQHWIAVSVEFDEAAALLLEQETLELLDSLLIGFQGPSGDFGKGTIFGAY